MAGKKSIRIGGATGFWGDSSMGAVQLVKGGHVDYLVFDYLAEITMSILARARAAKPDTGYALDFVSGLMKPLIRDIAEQGIKVVSNAGGVNPVACAKALEAVIAEAGVTLKVGVVLGDDLAERADDFRKAGVTEMFNGGPFPAKLMSMNAYLGAKPIAEALAAGADIVITGRVVDSAVSLGPCMYEFGWSDQDWDRLASGSLVGHILECGAQATGGIFTDWHLSRDWDDIGYPIAEVSADGSFVLCKVDGTGGLISTGTVGEQMLYEIGDPQAYLLPDVACDFSQVTMEQVGKDRVRVAGAKGRPPTDSYKVSTTYQDGYRAGMYISIIGIDAIEKARRTGESVLKRCRRLYRDLNMADFTDTSIEVVGAEDYYGPHARIENNREVILKIAAKHPEPRALEMMIREATSSATAMSPGTAGMGGNRPKVSPVVRLFSCLVPKADVPVSIEIGGERRAVAQRTEGGFDRDAIERPAHGESTAPDRPVKVPLIRLAWGRSGDKGNDSNIGIIARRREYLPYLRHALTEQAVADYFRYLWEGETAKVERYELPGIGGFNFLLRQILRGGGIASLRNDPQGKAMAQMLLDFPVPVPEALAASLDEVREVEAVA